MTKYSDKYSASLNLGMNMGGLETGWKPRRLAESRVSGKDPQRIKQRMVMVMVVIVLVVVVVVTGGGCTGEPAMN